MALPLTHALGRYSYCHSYSYDPTWKQQKQPSQPDPPTTHSKEQHSKVAEGGGLAGHVILRCNQIAVQSGQIPSIASCSTLLVCLLARRLARSAPLLPAFITSGTLQLPDSLLSNHA